MDLSARLASLLAVLVIAMPTGAGSAGDRPSRGGQQQAREAVLRGSYVPLAALLHDAEQRYPGRVIEVDLDDDDHTYEIEILLRDGRVVELTYDARDGRLLDVDVDDD